MAELIFQDLSFEKKRDKIRVNFLRIFYFYIPKDKLLGVGDFVVEKNSITFKKISQKKAEKRFYSLLENGFKGLINSLNNKRTIYIHKNSGIPLIGNVAFGLIDRDTNLIEIKPITGCNLKCIYCSVDEDRRELDFVIEEDYLVEEFRKLVEFKNVDGIEAHIASQGEPLLYVPLTDLIKDLSKIEQVKTISIDTNGILLTRDKVDRLVEAGLTRFNFSINALDDKVAKKLAGAMYNIKKIKEICRYIVKKTSLIITPVLVPSVNEGEMPKIIEFAKELGADIGIQNFLPYRFGRNPTKPMPFSGFYNRLREWEEKYIISANSAPVSQKLITQKIKSLSKWLMYLRTDGKINFAGLLDTGAPIPAINSTTVISDGLEHTVTIKSIATVLGTLGNYDLQIYTDDVFEGETTDVDLSAGWTVNRELITDSSMSVELRVFEMRSNINGYWNFRGRLRPSGDTLQGKFKNLVNGKVFTLTNNIGVYPNAGNTYYLAREGFNV